MKRLGLFPAALLCCILFACKKEKTSPYPILYGLAERDTTSSGIYFNGKKLSVSSCLASRDTDIYWDIAFAQPVVIRLEDENRLLQFGAGDGIPYTRKASELLSDSGKTMFTVSAGQLTSVAYRCLAVIKKDGSREVKTILNSKNSIAKDVSQQGLDNDTTYVLDLHNTYPLSTNDLQVYYKGKLSFTVYAKNK